jgi:cyclopropane-fatty-acyl-phospholipid synthase
VTDQTTAYRGASAAAIQHHYDVGNDFYALWLDPTLSYSCALWDGEQDNLQTAQKRKLDYLVTATRAAAAARVLDVGCGWGGLLRRLVELHDVNRVTGLTLSTAQATSIAGWANEHYDVRVENWIDHHPDGPYDAIISIGAFEHFADMGLTRTQRVDAYRAFFQHCYDWLPLGGRLAVQTNVKGNNTRLDRAMTRDLLFIIDTIFPESELPWPSEILQAAERRFDVVSIRNDPDDYARTCRAWLSQLQARHAEAEQLVGPAMVADYERYLAAAATAFTRRHLGLMRIIFEKV